MTYLRKDLDENDEDGFEKQSDRTLYLALNRGGNP
jgi:hypothetical protein